jgi:uncharacterized YigZ family protein
MSSPPADVARTVKGEAFAEIRIKGSRFVADIVQAASVESALAGVEAIRGREPDATHHCYAYRIGDTGNVFRANDDGEPTGTAGLPILRQIDRRGLIDTLVVVTRYYGGTKLGAGGLIRAYGEAASAALDEAEVVETIRRDRFELVFEYDLTSPAMQVIAAFDCDVVTSDYGAETRLTVAVRRSESQGFKEAWTETLAGRGVIRSIEA